MATTVLASVICRRLLAVPAESVIDSVWLPRYRENNAIGRDRCAGIEVGRPVIVKEDVLSARMPVVVTVGDVHVRSE
jgi:hypothetical protein